MLLSCPQQCIPSFCPASCGNFSTPQPQIKRGPTIYLQGIIRRGARWDTFATGSARILTGACLSVNERHMTVKIDSLDPNLDTYHFKTNTKDKTGLSATGRSRPQTQKTYNSFQHEFLTVIWAGYLPPDSVEGRALLIRTDYNTHKWILNLVGASRKLAPWRLLFLTWNFMSFPALDSGIKPLGHCNNYISLERSARQSKAQYLLD